MRKAILFLMIIIIINIIHTNQVIGHPDTSPPTLNSESAIIMELKTGEVLYEKNSNNQMFPASLTKIATAIFAIEQGNISETVTVSKEASDTGGSSVYLEVGEQVTLKTLIQGLLINSGNDAGVAIAEHLSGSMYQFSNDINEYLTNVIGVQGTSFENSHGLFNANHVITAADMAKVTQYAMNNRLFREIFGKKEFEWVGQSWETTLFKHHKLIREMPYEGITGGKTGFVNESGFTLATTAERDDLSLVVITLKSNSQSEAYKDTVNLLDYAFDKFQTSSILEGTILMSDDQKYKTDNTLYYTHSIDDQISQEINDNGILEVVNQDDIVIATLPLEKNIMETEMIDTSQIASEQNGVKTSNLFEKNLPTLTISGLFIVILSILFIFPKRKMLYNRKKL